jgi:hypothetical protein
MAIVSGADVALGLVTIAGLALWTPAVAFVFVIVDWPVQVRGR